MSINTNGFLANYKVTIENQQWLDKEEKIIQEALKIPNEKIDEIIREYNVINLRNKLKDVITTKNDNKHIREYYYFRAIVDGIYNIIKDYGWQYCSEIIDYAERKYGIKFYAEESFDICYRDYICELTTATYLQREFVDLDTEYLIYRDIDCDVCIKIPDERDIEKTLINIKNYAETYVKEATKQEEDKEYQMYLKLKEKYEGKDE